MAPRRPINVKKELLPLVSFAWVLATTYGQLKYYHWFSPVGTVYVWTGIWFTMSLISLRCLYRHGPLHVGAFGWMSNLWMLWDLYKKANSAEASYELADVVYAGILTVVVGGLDGYILATRIDMNYTPALPAEDEGKDESREAEKA
ncbi:hypothetical protein D0860_08209 [Hortaea werneckii]|uniref:Uncharacterized protein n=1 Tax=Hortaea werneckii TaxID=91943 RepID=A0A3M7GFC3_HORWE|nr:hypothetical protein D0860_08209 [Hortaea werneckii]